MISNLKTFFVVSVALCGFLTAFLCFDESITTVYAGQITTANYHPCLLAKKKAQDTMGKENRKVFELMPEKKKQLDRKAFDEWYNCEQVTVYTKVLDTIKEYEGACVRSCEDNKRVGCEAEMEMLTRQTTGRLENHKKRCPN